MDENITAERGVQSGMVNHHGSREREPFPNTQHTSLSDLEGTRPPTTRNASLSTIVEGDANKATLQPMEKIETERKDINDNDEHRGIRVLESVREGTQALRRKLYLHGRHRKGLTHQFTAHGVKKHIQATPDRETQLAREETQSPSVWQNFIIMFTTFPYWNMAFWSGWCYSIGSAMFIVDAAWSWIPQKWPDTEFKNQSKYGVPLMFFFGACLYQIGGVMAYLEAVNDGSFAGAAMKRLLEGHQDIEKELLDAKLHKFFGHLVPHHHHGDDEDQHDQRHHSSGSAAASNSLDKSHTPEELYAETKHRAERRGGIDEGPAEHAEHGKMRGYISWRWWPTWYALRTYHIYELGYLACTIQLFGVTLYGVTSVVILPGIFDSLVWWQELAAYWIPQVVASVCFLVASIMFTITAQDKWHTPKWDAVSWWIGIHAITGSVGFLLCAIFGLYSNDHEWAEFQSSMSSFWGSFFYMLSGLFQWYEAINVNISPVLAFPNNRTPVLLRSHRQQIPEELANSEV
ncbi:hypothetical protein R6Q59_009837 [Mikania micrantha]